MTNNKHAWFKEISWGLDGARSRIAFHSFRDVSVKTLLIELPKLMNCLSSRDGFKVEKFSLAEEEFEDFKVCAFVTAGVGSNAMRVGVDRAGSMEREGKFEKLRTINIIILTNYQLSDGAMVHSIITATEANVIALQDLNVKSSYNPELQATGTGTDNMVIVSGEGPKIHYMGGHSKAGELLAKAVTRATKEAILKSWNGRGL